MCSQDRVNRRNLNRVVRTERRDPRTSMGQRFDEAFGLKATKRFTYGASPDLEFLREPSFSQTLPGRKMSKDDLVA